MTRLGALDARYEGTYAIVHPIVVAVYGSSLTTKALAECLAVKIDHYEDSSREDMIVSVCWDWMPGGTTAAAVGAEIEAALVARQASSSS